MNDKLVLVENLMTGERFRAPAGSLPYLCEPVIAVRSDGACDSSPASIGTIIGNPCQLGLPASGGVE